MSQYHVFFLNRRCQEYVQSKSSEFWFMRNGLLKFPLFWGGGGNLAPIKHFVVNYDIKLILTYFLMVLKNVAAEFV